MTREPEGARLLLLIRDHGPLSFADLCRRLGVSHMTTEAVFVEASLRALRDAGLISLTPRGAGQHQESWGHGEISISELWPRIQTALRVSLVELAELGHESLIVRPFFGRPTTRTESRASERRLYAVMPFLPEMTPIYVDHIVKVAQVRGFRPFRSDELHTVGIVMSEVWSSIYGAEVVLVDCTGRNPNVFYELGLAHTIGKPVVLVTQSSADVPFDTRHVRFIEYEYTPRGMRAFEDSLGKALDALYQRGASKTEGVNQTQALSGEAGANLSQPALGTKVNDALGLGCEWALRATEDDGSTVLIGRRFVTRREYARADRTSLGQYRWLQKPDDLFSAEVIAADAVGFCAWASRTLTEAMLIPTKRVNVGLLAGEQGGWSDGVAERFASGTVVEDASMDAHTRKPFRIKVRFVSEGR